ncbi:MAG TPA: hypothetical protein VL137_02275 [Polyangiaceae bacterium]|jgi:hypothetical protein|nr:hypothetical protein [Polyangiaceae bacterium]
MMTLRIRFQGAALSILDGLRRRWVEFFLIPVGLVLAVPFTVVVASPTRVRSGVIAAVEQYGQNFTILLRDDATPFEMRGEKYGGTCGVLADLPRGATVTVSYKVCTSCIANDHTLTRVERNGTTLCEDHVNETFVLVGWLMVLIPAFALWHTGPLKYGGAHEPRAAVLHRWGSTKRWIDVDNLPLGRSLALLAGLVGGVIVIVAGIALELPRWSVLGMMIVTLAINRLFGD